MAEIREEHMDADERQQWMFKTDEDYIRWLDEIKRTEDEEQMKYLARGEVRPAYRDNTDSALRWLTRIILALMAICLAYLYFAPYLPEGW